MKAGEECRECLEILAGRIAGAASGGETAAHGLSLAAALAARDAHYVCGTSVPTRIATHMLRAARKFSDREDIFDAIKADEYARGGEAARRLRPLFGDTLSELCALAAAGNRIDFFREIDDVEREWRGFDHGLAVDDTDALAEELEAGGPLLYLADNAGELPFDLPLLAEFRRRGVETVHAVKGLPSQNDLTVADLARFGHSTEGTIHTGTDWVGCELSETGGDFNRHWERSRIIFSKGMANAETLTEYPERLEGKRVFFCMVAKCAPVARLLGVPRGGAILYDGRRLFGD